MGAQEKIAKLRELVRNAYNAIANKGGRVPAVGERTVSNLPAAIESVPSPKGIHFPSEEFWHSIETLGDGRNVTKVFSINYTSWGYGDTLSFDSLKTIYAYNAAISLSYNLIKRVLFPKIEENISTGYGFIIDVSQNIEYIYLGANGKGNNLKTLFYGNGDRSNVIDIEFEQGFGHSIKINDTKGSSPITRETIVEHMLERLCDFNADPLDGFSPTLGLGTWLSRLTDEDIAIATSKGWTLA